MVEMESYDVFERDSSMRFSAARFLHQTTPPGIKLFEYKVAFIKLIFYVWISRI
jgi:hypothetical protein